MFFLDKTNLGWRYGRAYHFNHDLLLASNLMVKGGGILKINCTVYILVNKLDNSQSENVLEGIQQRVK